MTYQANRLYAQNAIPALYCQISPSQRGADLPLRNDALNAISTWVMMLSSALIVGMTHGQQHTQPTGLAHTMTTDHQKAANGLLRRYRWRVLFSPLQLAIQCTVVMLKKDAALQLIPQIQVRL